MEHLRPLPGRHPGRRGGGHVHEQEGVRHQQLALRHRAACRPRDPPGPQLPRAPRDARHEGVAAAGDLRHLLRERFLLVPGPHPADDLHHGDPDHTDRAEPQPGGCEPRQHPDDVVGLRAAVHAVSLPGPHGRRGLVRHLGAPDLRDIAGAGVLLLHLHRLHDPRRDERGDLHVRPERPGEGGTCEGDAETDLREEAVQEPGQRQVGLHHAGGDRREPGLLVGQRVLQLHRRGALGGPLALRDARPGPVGSHLPGGVPDGLHAPAGPGQDRGPRPGLERHQEVLRAHGAPSVRAAAPSRGRGRREGTLALKVRGQP
mmetsp:Transcript_72413/g.212481  ORF Transcript_72413/g.212481 Transcript_72413/m.212481 type:complete len:316 (+) Transcript_72413:825-1772(+)